MEQTKGQKEYSKETMAKLTEAMKEWRSRERTPEELERMKAIKEELARFPVPMD